MRIFFSKLVFFPRLVFLYHANQEALFHNTWIGLWPIIGEPSVHPILIIECPSNYQFSGESRG